MEIIIVSGLIIQHGHNDGVHLTEFHEDRMNYHPHRPPPFQALLAVSIPVVLLWEPSGNVRHQELEAQHRPLDGG